MLDILQELTKKPLPNHVAIIMDGNGRWAKKQGMMRTFGHQNAIKAVRDSIEACNDLNIKYLTLYAFSTENWQRPQEEVNLLMSLLAKTLKKELATLKENNVKLKAIGNLDKMPTDTKELLTDVMKQTAHHTKGVLTLALSYSGKEEITDAVKKIAQKATDGVIKIEDISAQLIEQSLYTHELPPVDLLIRTSGEQRLSNFLIWQTAYAEFYFSPILWPDFRKKDFFEAIGSYQQRERRFGKTTAQLND